jgi:hypothetical protein
MTDLLTSNLTGLALKDIDDFLGLSLPEDQRVPESSRVDYKEDMPQDLGNDVAALANSYGGLIFLGIRSDKNKNNIPVNWDGAQLGSDPSARISNHILSTVRPRPQFDTGLVKTASGYIAIIRVNEGDYPPYEYEKGNTVRIPIRINDTTRQASVRDIEMLMERRKVTKDSAQKVIATLQPDSLFPSRLEGMPGGGASEVRNDRVHKILLAPHRPVRWRLDSPFERKLERWIKSAFSDTRSFSLNFRSGTFYEVREIRNQANYLQRVWRISNEGGLGFARNIDHHGSPGEPIGDVAADLLFFFRLARLALEEGGSFGRVSFTDILASPSTAFLPKFPEPDGVHGYDEVGGVHFPPIRPVVLPGTTTWAEDLDFRSIQTPAPQVASILFDQLRASWGANIHYDRLLEAVLALDSQSTAPQWGQF